jgi:hypothetical protein
MKCQGIKDVFDAAIVEVVNPTSGKGGCCNVQ